MKLLFVYNANAGKLNGMLDSLHKIVSPSTYACNLCAITYGVFSEDEVWKKFREDSEMPMEFLHKDEFLKQYHLKNPSQYQLPLILTEENGDLEVLVSSEAMNKLKTASELIQKLKEVTV